MKLWLLLLGSAVYLASGIPAVAELPEEARRLHTTMERAIGACRDRMLAERIAASAQYSNSLAQAAEQCRRNGDLDGVLAITGEQKLLAGDGVIPEEDAEGSSPTLRRLRESYRASAGAIADRFAKQKQLLMTRYVEELEALKKRLTVEGSIQDAVTLRDYIALVQQEMGTASTNVAAADVTMVDCSACAGSGKCMAHCPKCSGSGKCSMCRGLGTRDPAFKGTSDRLMCVTCKRTGKCVTCEGTGKVEGTNCEKCRGSGKVPKPETFRPTPPRAR